MILQLLNLRLIELEDKGMDSIIVGATLVGSFGAAIAIQRMVLSFLLRAMHPPALGVVN